MSSYLRVAQFHPEVNVSVPLSPVNMRSQKLRVRAQPRHGTQRTSGNWWTEPLQAPSTPTQPKMREEGTSGNGAGAQLQNKSVSIRLYWLFIQMCLLLSSCSLQLARLFLHPDVFNQTKQRFSRHNQTNCLLILLWIKQFYLDLWSIFSLHQFSFVILCSSNHILSRLFSLTYNFTRLLRFLHHLFSIRLSA